MTPEKISAGADIRAQREAHKVLACRLPSFALPPQPACRSGLGRDAAVKPG
jgi:hypothetical protein